jgi:hypothetical protein
VSAASAAAARDLIALAGSCAESIDVASTRGCPASSLATSIGALSMSARRTLVALLDELDHRAERAMAPEDEVA